jgi:hypothetical protein
MHDNTQASATVENGVGLGSPAPDREIEARDPLFSGPLSSICYWSTILLLAIVGAYMIRWEIWSAVLNAVPESDFWGITTPPWLIAPLAPLGTLLSLGQAVWSALRGRRSWRMVMTAAGLILVLVSSRLLEASR